MPVTTCRHIKTNGKRCQSPTLGLSAFCYFHSRLHRRHRHLLETSSAMPVSIPNPTTFGLESVPPPPIELELPPIEDAESIQVSISLLIAALARNRIDPKRASVLLYALQLASSNARSITIEPNAPSVTRAVVRTRSGRDLATPDFVAAPKNTFHRNRKSNPAALISLPENIDKETYDVID